MLWAGERCFYGWDISWQAGFVPGPQAAVVCSMLFGSISGSTAANVATTGSFTIPMMKSAGYKAGIRAAVEGGWPSTGGQFMPPVMGSGLFVMVGLFGYTLRHHCLAALVPALLFYLSIAMAVELRARKDRIAHRRLLLQMTLFRRL